MSTIILSPFIREQVKLLIRAPGWGSLRNEFIVEFPYCAACETLKGIQVHHVKPVHLFPELELVKSNLISLCGDCHLVIGHLRNWKFYNPEVEEICRKIKELRKYNEIYMR